MQALSNFAGDKLHWAWHFHSFCYWWPWKVKLQIVFVWQVFIWSNKIMYNILSRLILVFKRNRWRASELHRNLNIAFCQTLFKWNLKTCMTINLKWFWWPWSVFKVTSAYVQTSWICVFTRWLLSSQDLTQPSSDFVICTCMDPVISIMLLVMLHSVEIIDMHCPGKKCLCCCFLGFCRSNCFQTAWQ